LGNEKFNKAMENDLELSKTLGANSSIATNNDAEGRNCPYALKIKLKHKELMFMQDALEQGRS